MASIAAADEDAMLALGRRTSRQISNGSVVFLVGELGSGKTTFVRGILSGLGYDSVVVSPTYTLVEPYHLADKTVYHFDLYRLKSSEELEMIGVRDMITEYSISLFEWPQRARDILPEPDMVVSISYSGSRRRLEIEHR